MLHLILADAELLLVPERLRNHPAIVRYAKKRGKRPGDVLLDSAYHHSVSKLGRPDIVHLSLLNALESILNREGMLRVYVHTIEDNVIYVEPTTRLPRNYNRFVGLMEDLFRRGCVPPKLHLMRIRRMSLEGLVGEIGAGQDEVFVLHERGTSTSPFELSERLTTTEDPVVIVGAFPHGDFKSPIPWRKFSVYPESLMTWTIVNEVIVNFEARLWNRA